MDDQLKRLRSSMADAGYDMKKMSTARSSSTPPECQKCGMGMLVATKEQFADRICGSCERASTPPSPEMTDKEIEETLAVPFTFDKDRISATPSSPETPAELRDAISDLLQAARSYDENHPPYSGEDEWSRALEAARNALVALYSRQREEWQSKLEFADGLIAAQARDLDSLDAEVERLKADQLTAEDARYCLDNPPYHGFKHELYAKLVRLRSSQSGETTDV